jgi:hypothetical protein
VHAYEYEFWIDEVLLIVHMWSREVSENYKKYLPTISPNFDTFFGKNFYFE